MSENTMGPKDPREKKTGQISETLPDVTPRSEGGEDSVESSSLSDSNADEIVIVNAQKGNKTVNTPSQTAANTSEAQGSDNEIINN